MKQYKCFRLRSIPDITLNKYKMGNVNGIDGIIEMHNIFLRQWNRKGIFSNISLHLLYVYKPDKPYGEKIEIFLLIRGEENELNNVKKLMRASLLMQQFDFDDEISMENDIFFEKYNKCCTLSKKELFIKTPKNENDDGTEYYSIANMEANHEGRLYQMMTLMSSFDEPIAFRVDLYPCDFSLSIRGYFENLMEYIQRKIEDKRQIGLNKKTSYLDDIIKDYNKIFQNIENNQHFIANIFAFGLYENPLHSDNLELILDAAATESIKSGNYSITSFYKEGNQYSPLSLLEYNDSMVSTNGKMHLAGYGKECWVYDKKAYNYDVRFLPVLWTVEEISSFFRLPLLYENEEIQKKKETSFRILDEKEYSINVGYDNYNREVKIPLNDFVKHIFISGVPGSGKTNAMLKILCELNKNKIPFLVFEPAKKEYRALLNYTSDNDVILLSPHLKSLFPIQVNPFEFPKGIILSQHIASLMKIFSGSFNMEKNVYEIIDSAIEQAYINCGWELDDVNDEKHYTYPTLSEVYDLAEKEIDKLSYSGELRGNVSSYIRVRLGGLMKRDSGEIFNIRNSSWRPEEWLEKSVIVEMEALAEQDKNFFVLLVCTLIYETLMVNKVDVINKECKLRHMIVIEEAHNIISQQSQHIGESVDSKISATAYIVKMLAEVRALGEGIIIADQLPSAMAPEVIKNTVTKFAMKMVSADDREIMGQSMLALDVQLDKLVTYKPGQALYFGDNMQKPIEILFSKWNDTNVKEVDEYEIFKNNCNKGMFVLWKGVVSNILLEFLEMEKEMVKTVDELDLWEGRIELYKELSHVGKLDFANEKNNCSKKFIMNMSKIRRIINLYMLSGEEEYYVERQFFEEDFVYELYMECKKNYDRYLKLSQITEELK